MSRNTINEPIDVSVLFRAGRVQPSSFLWRRRLYRIKKINGHYSDYKGRWKRYHYAVQTDTPEVYEICLDTETMSWELTRVHGAE